MNKVMLIGNVGKEPDVRYYDADQAVAQVTFATTEKGYTLANGTQVPDRTEWHSLVFYRTLAKIVEKYVHKGDKLYVEGKIRYRFFDDKQGKRRFVTEFMSTTWRCLPPNRLLLIRMHRPLMSRPRQRRHPLRIQTVYLFNF